MGTICFALWFVGWRPLVQADEQQFHSWDFRHATDREFTNPACRDYQVQPMSALREPGYDQGCWAIYNSRRYDATGTVPYTLAVYDRNRDAQSRNVYLAGLGIGAVITVTLGALIYLVGWVTAWILGGFRRTAS